ncbi:DEAD/DEAH box helicase [Pyrococcus abyssi]|uniref:Large helicase-related protein n=1 Tax=Pyrococcus abyssi (strain GE5 / Orsay) TaxID=272844 RepID=Q9V0H2_PYRAB|nr:DEAD/DEAH box helicase [Pyrococcus abyssi]CAB49731.1 lhr-1 large helicase-related protein [Pyrococcus abyssi GE5]CCE70218.1 TPA: large helicase-related protein [Pyrococcus abyssi GE5]
MHILLKKAIKEKFRELNRLQIEAFKRISEGKSVLIIAPTGSGKTEAAILPVMNSILKDGLPPISCLYIAPLKALNRDLLERLKWWEAKTGIRIDVRHGDTTQYRRAKQVRNPPHVLITTPETLPALLTVKSLRPYLKNVRFVVVDEVTELIDNKRGAQLILNLKRLSLIADFIRIGLSATVGNEEEVKEWLGVDEIVKPPLKKRYKFKVLFPRPRPEDKELAELLRVDVEVAARLRTLWEIVEKHKRVLVFVNTRQFAEVLAHRLKTWGKPVEVHHGSLSKEARIEAERKLKEGKVKALICTSSMELGIDIGEVDAVIQYMSPRQVNRLIQRAGRSKHRLLEVSEAYIIATGVEDYLQSLIIAKRAIEGKLERIKPYENALDVLAHFIVGLLIEYQKLNVHEPYRMAKETYPYRNLKWEHYLEVINVLEDAGIIRREEGILKLGRRAFKYYFDNLSTIPDEVSYKVVDIGSGKVIGRLDENFVMDLEEGMEFIMHGRSWLVLEIDGENLIIKVRESENIEGAIPSWEGELIPVPYEVAREVGRLRRTLLYDPRKAPDLIKGVEFNGEELELALNSLKQNTLIPSDRDIIITVLPDTVIIHSDLGNKVNEGISRYILGFLYSKYGRVFTAKSQAHSIIIHAPFKMNPNEVKEILLKDYDTKTIISKTIRDSTVYRWKMINVAKRMGALSKRARIRNVQKLFEGTIIEVETLNEVFHDKVDVQKVEEVLKLIAKGEIRITGRILNEPEEIDKEHGTISMEFMVSLHHTDEEIVELFKQRIMDSSIVMVCTNCGFSWETKVGRVINRVRELECPKCGSIMLAPLHPKDAELFKVALKKLKHGEKLSRNEERAYIKGLKAADLLKSYKDKALLALGTYGVGVETASRVLSKASEKELIKELIKLERQYIRTKKFWD